MLDTKTFLIYSGLKSYRGLFWGLAVGHTIISCAFGIVAGISGDLYLLFWRLEWGYWVLALFGGLTLLVIYGAHFESFFCHAFDFRPNCQYHPSFSVAYV